MLAAAALIPPLSWELPYAMDVALKSKKKKKAEVSSKDGVRPRFANLRAPTLKLTGC